MKILVTGGTGYIGSHTVVELQQQGFEVVIVDNLSNSQASVVDAIEKITGIRPLLEVFDLVDREKTADFSGGITTSKVSFTLRPLKLWASRWQNHCFTTATTWFR